jgi:hypothetical protein
MDLIEEIKRLKSLYDEGAITENEFNELKGKVINKQTPIPLTESDATNNIQSISKRSPLLVKKAVLISVFALVAIIVVMGIKYSNNSPKRIITTGDKWILSNSDEINDSKVGKEISFNESSVNLLGENKISDIKWIDNTSYSQDFNGKNGIVKMRKVSNSAIELSFIFDSNNIPISESDWEKLKREKKVNYIIRSESKNKEKTNEYFKNGEITKDKKNEGDDVQVLLSEEIGSFQNGKANIKYDEFKNLLDRQYAEYSSNFQNLIFEIDDKYLLTTDKSNYPFDIMLILFKIYPNNARKSYLEQERLTSIGGVVYEKRYGTWILINKNFILVPINPNACYRTMYQMNPINEKSYGTIQLRYYETYTFAIGSFNHTDITYSFSPYLEEVSVLKQTSR